MKAQIAEWVIRYAPAWMLHYEVPTGRNRTRRYTTPLFRWAWWTLIDDARERVKRAKESA